MSGFSGGLATGLLVSALAAAIFLFSYTHRRQFGESLIHAGERLAAKNEPERPVPKAESEPQAVPPAPSVSALQAPRPTRVNALTPDAKIPKAPLISSRPGTSSLTQAAARTPLTPTRPVLKKLPQKTQPPPANAIKPTQARLNQPVPASTVPRTASVPAQPPVTRAAAGPAPSPVSSVAFPSAKATFNPDTIAPPPQSEIVAANRGLDPTASLQMFFDLGRFKQEQLAQSLSDRVAHLGMRTSVVQKGRLWMNSYQVLVGPYATEDEEKKIHGDLASNGIKALPFERGSRSFAFRSLVNVAGASLPVGDFTISWESYVADAKVKFMQGHDVIATADGKWIKRPQKFTRSEYVYQNQGGDSHPLIEVHFVGLDRALVFR